MARIHKNWIASYLNYTRHSESPEAFHFWTAVSTIGGALRRRVWIDQRIFHWTPNFYIILVAPPGVATKSTSVNIGMNILRRVDGPKFGPQAITWQALTQALAEAHESVPIGKDEYGEDLMYTMSCLTCAISELGTFLVPEDSQMVSALIGLYDGQLGVWDKLTKTQGGDKIYNPWLNIIGCTTPNWISQHFDVNLIEGGLSSRILFVYANKKRQLVAYPGKSWTAKEFEAETMTLAQDLAIIAAIGGEYTLSDQADEWGEAWYKKLHTSRPVSMASDRWQGYFSRKQAHVHKLAIVLAAAEGSELVIERHHLQNADRAITDLEHNMEKVFNVIGESPQHKHLGIAIGFLQTHGGKMAEQQLWSNCFPFMSSKDFQAAMSGGIAAKSLRRQTVAGIGAVIFIVGEASA